MITEALETVTAISQQMSLPMLETLIYIKEHTDEFSLRELRDFYIVMADFEKLLTPA
jgi:hypothetical protein